MYNKSEIMKQAAEKMAKEKLSEVADEILDFIATKNINVEDFKFVWDLVIKKSFKRFHLKNRI